VSQFRDEVMIALRFLVEALDSNPAFLTKDEKAAAKKVAQMLETQDRCPPEYLSQIEAAAKAEFADNEINIDPLTIFDVIEVEDGTWVRAWVYLAHSSEEEDGE